jgi:hypothetical protein
MTTLVGKLMVLHGVKRELVSKSRLQHLQVNVRTLGWGKSDGADFALLPGGEQCLLPIPCRCDDRHAPQGKLSRIHSSYNSVLADRKPDGSVTLVAEARKASQAAGFAVVFSAF